MKEFKCYKCGIYLGEMEKGKIKNGAVLICKECIERDKIGDSLRGYKNATRNSSSNPLDIFGDIFKGKK
jgi:hypothetical protein